MNKVWLSGMVLAAAFAAGSAQAAVTVIGAGYARGCYQAALHDTHTRQALETCNSALSEQPLDRHNRAATLVNRGIVHLNRTERTEALADFDQAIALEPNLAEAHTNRGAALLATGDYQGAVNAANQAIALQPTEPHKAYFIRAAAYEELGDMGAAYRDYRQATQLAPDWGPARIELARFRHRAS